MKRFISDPLGPSNYTIELALTTKCITYKVRVKYDPNGAS